MKKTLVLKIGLLIMVVAVITVAAVAVGTTVYKGKEKDNKVVESTSEVDELNRTYTTKFGLMNKVTYPVFTFDYSDNWTITEEGVTQENEFVTLTNDRGVTIKYSHFAGLPKDYNFGMSTISMLRVDISKVGDSDFIPSYVQATDHSELGTFIVAKLKVTGELDMQNDSYFKDIDGNTAYALVPQSYVGTREDIRGPFEGEFSFWYSSHISFVASSPDGEFTKDETQEIIKILGSFKTK